MTYELAKQLKDAGFPQQFEWTWYCSICTSMFSDDTNCKCDYSKLTDDQLDNKDFTNPSLSQLIEAFKDDTFGDLELYIETSGHTKATSQRRSTRDGFIEGDTPDEAIAKLWLSLHPNP